MYRLVKFGTLSLEHKNQVDAIGSGATPTSYQVLPEGGALDNFGNQQKAPGVVERVKSLRLTASTVDDLNDLYMQLLALRGKRDRLYRRTASGDIHWAWARLVEVSASRDYLQTRFKRIQDLDLRFAVQEATWRGDLGGEWYFDSGEYFDSGLSFDSGNTTDLSSSPTELTLTLGAASDAGRAPTCAVRIVITAGDVPFTAIQIARDGGETLIFGGTVAATKELVIDSGTMQVTNDGADAYDDLSFTATADLATWFALEAGDNDITITFTGGGTGATIAFSYYEAWF